MSVRARLGASVLFLSLSSAAPAHAWEWFRSPNSQVEAGNQRMAEGEHERALEHYDEAARSLPDARGVQLDRGLALSALGKQAEARQAFLAATEPPADPELRADAYYNLGNSFYREADDKAGEGQHEEAQRLFREALDSYRRSLKLQPGNDNAAWNLELARRRIREEKKKQEQKEQREQQEQREQEGEQDSQQQAQNDGQQQQQQQDRQAQDQQPSDSTEQQRAQDDASDQKKQQAPDPSEQQRAERPPRDQAESRPRESRAGEEGDEQQQARAIPRDVEQALDALQNSEQNLEQLRALRRAQRERRRVEKDW